MVSEKYMLPEIETACGGSLLSHNQRLRIDAEWAARSRRLRLDSKRRRLFRMMAAAGRRLLFSRVQEGLDHILLSFQEFPHRPQVLVHNQRSRNVADEA